MSRRKQAKPRALKRGEWDSESLHDQDMLPDDVQSDGSATDRCLANGAVKNDSSIQQGDEADDNDFSDSTCDKYRCETCGVNLDSLRRFMDHRNFECVAGLDEAATALLVGATAHVDISGGTCAMETENSVESDLNGTPSWRSDTPDDQSLSPSSCCATPPDPDVELSGTVGVTESTPYACQFCDRAFPRLSYLKRHEQSHGDQMPFKCDFCHRLFKHKRSRDRHVKLHTGDKKYRCPHCEAAFSRSDHLKIHMKTHDTAKPFQCTTCNRGYNTAAALTSHMQNHKKESAKCQKKQCPKCSAQFTTAQQLQTHMIGHNAESEKILHCIYCQHICCGFDSMANHMDATHPTEKQLKCPVCSETFSTLEALYEHKKVHEESATTIEDDAASRKGSTKHLSCVYCTKDNFSSEEALQLHVQAMHGGAATLANGEIPSSSVSPANIMVAALAGTVPFAHQQNTSRTTTTSFNCEYCTMKFPSVQALQKHTLTVHSFTEVVKAASGSKDVIFCSHCTMMFASTVALADHIKLVHGMGSSNSQTPGSKTAQSIKDLGLKSSRAKGDCKADEKMNGDHQFTHPGTLLCNQCNAAFPDFESFRTHLKTHLDEVIQKFVCGECQGEFGSEEQLDGHIVTHYASTTTEYGCQCCLKLFSKPDELQKHLMDIHAHHLYRCSLCKEMFDSKVSIQVHFAVKHSNECKLFKCTACNSVFRSEMEFQLHVKVAHLRQVKPFRCLFCNLSFAAELELQCHLMSHKKQFSCNLCDEAFHVEFLLDKHMQTKHAGIESNTDSAAGEVPASSSGESANGGSPGPGNTKNKMKCAGAAAASGAASTVCAPSSSASGGGASTSSVTANICGSTASNKKETKCDICDLDLNSEAALTTHRKQVHNIKTSQKSGGQQTLSLYCAYCNEACKSRTELENHMKVHTLSSSKHKCNICDEVCPTASILAEHKLTHCKVIAGSLCVVCKVNLKSEDQYYSHLQQHNSQGLPLPCVVCRQTLMSEIEVQMHAKFHLKNAEPLFPCCFCLKQLELNNLVVSSGGGNGQQTYICKECFHNDATSNHSVASSLMGSGSKADEIRCGECKVKFESELDLEVHQKVHQKTYQCIKCQMSFGTEAEIQLHVASHMLHEGINHECRLCHKVFDSPAKLQCHLIEHTFEGCAGYTCYMCSAVFTTAPMIQQHMLEHGLNSRPYDCTHCHQKFFFRSELENHVFSHCHEQMLAAESSNQLQCPECLRTFSSALHLTNHRKIHREQKNKSNGYKSISGVTVVDENLGKRPPFRCSECGQDFPCLSNLQGHMRLHTHGTKFTCPECSKEFALSRNLNIHMRLHSGEKPYECPMCKKRFARKENRKAHLKSHSGIKPFMCPHCGKSFSRKCHVKEHMRLHETSTSCGTTNEASPSSGSLACEFCPDLFASTDTLNQHVSEVHPRTEREHACKMCDERFFLLKNLKKHTRRVHSLPVEVEGIGDGKNSSAASSPDHSSSTSTDIKDAMETCECSSSVPEESGSSRGPSPPFKTSNMVVDEARNNSTPQEVMACQ
uniref:C2H2-type domain-containing protein n=1 Tax=Strigamia maritima TaxID=126957 RepID=T1J283_STRMM